MTPAWSLSVTSVVIVSLPRSVRRQQQSAAARLLVHQELHHAAALLLERKFGCSCASPILMDAASVSVVSSFFKCSVCFAIILRVPVLAAFQVAGGDQSSLYDNGIIIKLLSPRLLSSLPLIPPPLFATHDILRGVNIQILLIIPESLKKNK